MNSTLNLWQCFIIVVPGIGSFGHVGYKEGRHIKSDSDNVGYDDDGNDINDGEKSREAGTKSLFILVHFSAGDLNTQPLEYCLCQK